MSADLSKATREPGEAERERCAIICENLADVALTSSKTQLYNEDGNLDRARAAMAKGCARAIRSLGPDPTASLPERPSGESTRDEAVEALRKIPTELLRDIWDRHRVHSGPAMEVLLRAADYLAAHRPAPRPDTERAELIAAERDRAVLAWAVETFGQVAADRRERVLRFVEEAIEVGHAHGLSRDDFQRIVDRIYNRQTGDLHLEIAQAGMTLGALAACLGVDLDEAIGREFARVRGIPKEEWERRHAAKTALGITADAKVAP